MIPQKAKELLDKLRRTNYRQNPDFGMDRLSERLIKVITNECKSTLLERDEHGNLKPKRYGSDIIINNLHQIARQLILNGTIIPKEVMNRIICTEGRMLGINSDLYLYKGVQEDENQNMERVVATSNAVIDISGLGQEVSMQIGELHTEFAKQFIIEHLEQLPKVSRISVITQQLFHGKKDRNFLAEKFTAVLRENTEYSDTIIDSTVNYHLDYMYGKATEREILKTINNGNSLVPIDKKKQKVSFKHLTDVVAAESQDLSKVIPDINNILTDLQQVYSDVETQLIAYSTDLTQLTPKEIEGQIKTVNRSSLKDSELKKYLKEDGYRHVDVGIKGKDVVFVKNQNVPQCMQKLSADIYDLVQNLESMSEEQYLQRAVQLQYRFIRIHPFPDSNGRTSRALLNMMTIPKGILIEVTKENKGDFVAAQRKTGEILDKQGFTDILNNNQEQLLDEMERENIDSPIYNYIRQNCVVDISKYDESSNERYAESPTVELKEGETTYDSRR